MNSVNLQDTKLMYKNATDFCILTVNYHKEKLRKQSYLQVAPIRIKYLGINLTELKDLYSNNCKTLIKETEDDKQMEIYTGLMNCTLQYSCLENPMDGGAWQAAVHGIAKSQARLSKFIFSFHFQALEKEMATHSSILAWRIPGTEEPSGLLSMGSHRVGHNSSDLAAAAA